MPEISKLTHIIHHWRKNKINPIVIWLFWDILIFAHTYEHDEYIQATSSLHKLCRSVTNMCKCTYIILFIFLWLSLGCGEECREILMPGSGKISLYVPITAILSVGGE